MTQETSAFQVGDRVKLVLDKERSPDNQFHGRTGEITDIEFDDLGETTGRPEDSFIYTVELDGGRIPDIHFRRHDLVLVGSE
jgi:ribosomal protein L21E